MNRKRVSKISTDTISNCRRGWFLCYRLVNTFQITYCTRSWYLIKSVLISLCLFLGCRPDQEMNDIYNIEFKSGEFAIEGHPITLDIKSAQQGPSARVCSNSNNDSFFHVLVVERRYYVGPFFGTGWFFPSWFFSWQKDLGVGLWSRVLILDILRYPNRSHAGSLV